MKAGAVVTANFPGAVNSKRRPAVIVSSEIYHRERPDVILALITTNIAKAIKTTDYILQDWSSANLKHSSAVIPNENWFAKNYFRIVNKISVIE